MDLEQKTISGFTPNQKKCYFETLEWKQQGVRFLYVELHKGYEANQEPFFTASWNTSIHPQEGLVAIAGSFANIRSTYEFPLQKYTDKGLVEECSFFIKTKDDFISYSYSLDEGERIDAMVEAVKDPLIPDEFHFVRVESVVLDYFMDGTLNKGKRQFGLIAASSLTDELVELFKKTADVANLSEIDFIYPNIVKHLRYLPALARNSPA